MRARVLTLADRLEPVGGVAELVHAVLPRLDRSRFEVTFCVDERRRSPDVSDPGVAGVLAAYREAGIRVVGIRSARAFAALLARGRFDVVHAHKYRQNALAAVAGRLAGVPVLVAHEHTWHYGYWPERILVDRHVIGRLADAFVAVSPEDARQMIEVEGVRPEVVRHIPNGIPPLVPSGPRASVRRRVRAELGIAEDEVVVGTLAWLRRQKRLDLLVRVAPAVDARIVLVGGGPEEASLRRLADSVGAGDRVVFAGPRSDKADVLSAFDVAVCCSDYEGSPLAVMEALQAGLPVVGTRVGGVPDLVADGVTGLLVPPDDPAALAAAVRRLVDSPGLRTRLGSAAADRAGGFGVKTTVRGIEALYDELLGQPGRTHE